MESDADGYSSSLLYKIVDHKSSGEATKMANKYLLTKTGTKRMRQTTQGWKFLVQWANGTRQWIYLKILKESNPVQVAEYVTSRNMVGPLCFEEARCDCFCCDYNGMDDKSQIWD